MYNTIIDDDWSVVWAIEKSVLSRGLSEQSKSQFCIRTYDRSAAGGAVAALCCYCSCFYFCYVDTVCGLTTAYLDLMDLIDYNCYSVRFCTTYEYVFVYTCLLLCSVLLYCCCCSCCCLLLLFIVCQMASFVRVVHGVWSQCSLCLYPNTPWQYYRIFSIDFFYLECVSYIHPRYYGHARSQGGR